MSKLFATIRTSGRDVTLLRRIQVRHEEIRDTETKTILNDRKRGLDTINVVLPSSYETIEEDNQALWDKGQDDSLKGLDCSCDETDVDELVRREGKDVDDEASSTEGNKD